MLVLARIRDTTVLAADLHKKQNSSLLNFTTLKSGVSSVLTTKSSSTVCEKKESELGTIFVCRYLILTTDYRERVDYLRTISDD